jgi:hypothetical protein
LVEITLYSPDNQTSVVVQLENISTTEYAAIQGDLIARLQNEQAFSAIAHSFVNAVTLCPQANPSDIWQHIIYRTYISSGRNEQSWKRASGQGFEEALAEIYNPRLIQYGIRLIVLSRTTATKALGELGLTGIIAPSKMDIAIEGNCNSEYPNWKIFGVLHMKASIAERIQDDAPASRALMEKGFFSGLVTLDSKSFPPPHGNGINYGELGGRVEGNEVKRLQIKRNIFEIDGAFNVGISFNLRTPPSIGETQSGCRIRTLSFNMPQPDEFVQELVNFWNSIRERICAEQPTTEVLTSATS